MSRQYKNPPIQEAICAFQFVPGAEWDVTVVGRFHERIKEDYPAKPETERSVETSFSRSSAPEEAELKLHPRFDRFRLASEDRKRLIIVGKDSLSVHALRPYAGWDEDFRPRVKYALEKYAETVDLSGIQQIGLRYINKIRLPGNEIALEKYLALPPVVPEGFPNMLRGFHSRFVVEYADEPIKLMFTLASSEPQGEEIAFLLDLDLVWPWVNSPLPIDSVMNKVDDMRGRERKAFEALITDKARDLFDED